MVVIFKFKKHSKFDNSNIMCYVQMSIGTFTIKIKVQHDHIQI
jgi:hypothetical protein